jgi:hypothetical protein
MKLRRESTVQKHDRDRNPHRTNSGPLDMQAPDQQQGWIAENKRRIKQCVISNPVISLDRQISSTQRSTTMVDPPNDQIKS